MAQAGSQFTAEQILEAGRRAEADGRIDYAIQFYRHLTDHLPRAAETAAAREALARIAQRRAETMNGYAGGAAAGQNGHTYGQGASAHHAPGPATPAGYPAAGGADSAAPRAAYAMPDPASRGSGAHGAQPGIRVAPVGAAAIGAFELPPRRDGYRMGRWIARLTAGVGWLCIALGLIALVLLGVGQISGLPRAGGLDIAGMVLASGGLGGPTLLLSGLLLVFWSQLARAVFDNANAARELVAIERAKAGEPE